MARETPDATLIATLTTPPQTPQGIGLAAALEGVSWLEVRADLTGDLDPAPLRRQLGDRRLLYTLRSRAEGGAWDGSAERRKRRLLDAAERYDLVDLEAQRDLSPDLLKAIPPEKRVLSWHGPATGLPGLQACFERMAAAEAALYKLVPMATQAGEELPPLELLAGLERRDVIAFAAGAVGAWTRLVAPRLGAPVVYGALGDIPGAPGQITVRRLREDFGLPALRPVRALFGIAGNPVAHSLSPRLHNTAYAALDIPALYVPFHVESFGDFWLEVVEAPILERIGMPLRGLSVTTPYKETALAVAGAASPRAELINSANTLVCNQGVWEAETTDPDGVVLPLRRRGIDPVSRNAAVVGTGGAGRAAAEGLLTAGARVTLVNRSAERGRHAAEILKLPFVPLDELRPAEYDLLVNATSLGRVDGEPLPFPVDGLRPGTIVIDLVYGERPTHLVRAAGERGLLAIDGREVLVSQAVGQLRMMTGRDLPVDLALRTVGLPGDREA